MRVVYKKEMLEVDGWMPDSEGSRSMVELLPQESGKFSLARRSVNGSLNLLL